MKDDLFQAFLPNGIGRQALDATIRHLDSSVQGWHLEADGDRNRGNDWVYWKQLIGLFFETDHHLQGHASPPLARRVRLLFRLPSSGAQAKGISAASGPLGDQLLLSLCSPRYLRSRLKPEAFAPLVVASIVLNAAANPSLVPERAHRVCSGTQGCHRLASRGARSRPPARGAKAGANDRSSDSRKSQH